MKLLVHNGAILTANPVEEENMVAGDGVVFYKSTMPGWEIIDVDVPANFDAGKYAIDQNGLRELTNIDQVPEEVDSIAAIIVLEQNNLGVAYQDWVTSPSRTRIEKEIISRRGRWRRDNVLLNQAAEGIGITQQQLDAMFVAASKINV